MNEAFKIESLSTVRVKGSGYNLNKFITALISLENSRSIPSIFLKTR